MGDDTYDAEAQNLFQIRRKKAFQSVGGGRRLGRRVVPAGLALQAGQLKTRAVAAKGKSYRAYFLERGSAAQRSSGKAKMRHDHQG